MAPDFRADLRDQLELLQRCAQWCDEGSSIGAKEIAVKIRVLLHDTGKPNSRRKSTSVLTHLGVKSTTRLLSTSPGGPADADVVFQFGMGSARFGDGGDPIRPSLGAVGWRLVPVEEWWEQPVHVFDGGATRVSRKDIVLGAANKMGGAHRDPNLEGAFKRLAQDGAFLRLGTRLGGVEVMRALLDIYLTNLRDMAFEIAHSPDILVLASKMFPGPCDDCSGKVRADAREPRIVRRNTFSATQCHELTCGHGWHVTATLEGGVASPIIYPHACDCALGEYDSRIARLVGKKHRAFAAYAWGKYQAEGRGAVVAWEVDVRKKLDIPADIEIEPVYGFGYCTVAALEGTNLPTWVKENAERVLPAVREYDPEEGYIVLGCHLDGAVPATVLSVDGVPPMPPDADPAGSLAPTTS